MVFISWTLSIYKTHQSENFISVKIVFFFSDVVGLMSSVKLIQFLSNLLLKAKQAQGNPFVKCIYFYICQMGFLEPDLISHLTNEFILTFVKCIYFYICCDVVEGQHACTM